MISKLFQAGQTALKQRHSELESTKKGILRGGNSGLQLENGDIVGTCAGQTYLRFKGVDISVLESSKSTRELMFEAGRFNEDAWYDTLAASGWAGTIKREEEIPIKWTTNNGTLVTGRPDMVLLDPKGKPQHGIELKLVCSIWTARTVLINRTPKLSHMCQATHYSWQVGVPFEIWYTNRTDFEASSDFNLQSYPSYGDPGSEHFIYRFHRHVADPSTGEFRRQAIDERMFLLLREAGEDVEAKVGKYLPFTQGFRLLTDEKTGLVSYQLVSKEGHPSAAPKQSIVSVDRLKRFYNTVAELQTVPEEPLTLKPDGKKENFKLSAYCPLGKLCCKNRAGQNAEEWAEEVSDFVNTSSSSGDTVVVTKKTRPLKSVAAAPQVSLEDAVKKSKAKSVKAKAKKN